MAYENYREWKRWDSESFGSWSREEGIYFGAEMAKCRSSGLAGAHVLELGFGNGAFAGWARNEGATYIGVEAIADLVSRGSEAGFDVHFSNQGLHEIAASDSLDLVVAFDVFEHLSRKDFEQMCREIRDVLKVGGCLIARVPSGDSPFARAIQNGDLTHRLTLGSSAVRQVAAAMGFEVEQCRESAFPRVGLGLRSFVRRSMVASARALAYPFIVQVFMGGGSPVLSPDMVFVFRKAGPAEIRPLQAQR